MKIFANMMIRKSKIARKESSRDSEPSLEVEFIFFSSVSKKIFSLFSEVFVLKS